MKPVKIAAAVALSVGLCAPAAVGTAHADDQTPPPGVNARGMSPNKAEAAVDIHWTNAERVFKFFVRKGLSKKQSAGIVGNLIVESGVNPGISQVGGGPGRGIAQWSVGGRWDTYDKDNNVWYTGTLDLGPKTIGGQARFIWYELKEFSYYGLSGLKGADTVTSATKVFMTEYEGCGTCHTDRRVDYAKKAYDKFG